jgi:signal transduction histidine kinase
MCSKNDKPKTSLPLRGSLRLTIALSFAILFCLSSLMLLSVGFFLFKQNLHQALGQELTAAARQYERAYCGFYLRHEEHPLALANVPNVVRQSLRKVAPKVYLNSCKQKEERDGVLTFYGSEAGAPVSLSVRYDGTMVSRKNGSPKSARDRLRARFEGSPGRLAFWALFSSEDELLASGATEAGLPKNSALLRGRSVLAYGAEKYLLCRYAFLEGEYQLVLGMNLAGVRTALRGYLRAFSLCIIPICFLAAALGWLLSRRALRGVLRVAEATEAFGAGTLSVRVQKGREGNEVERLISMFNQMAAQVQKLLQEQREMTDNIAHDLRTPVTRMRGIVEVAVAANSEREAYREMAGQIAEECDLLSNLINTMLEISQGESGTLVLACEPVDLYDVAAKAVDLFRLPAESKRQTLTLRGTGPAMVSGDLSRLQRVVANLLDNAGKYTPEQGAISVDLSQDERQVRLRICDSGPGIPEKKMNDVFRRFYRGEWSRTTQGSGLGLALVKVLVESHGGTIALQNLTPGLRVEVVLPRIVKL